jgi:hypothetical protein
MKVEDLIELLKRENPKAEVVVPVADDNYDVYVRDIITMRRELWSSNPYDRYLTAHSKKSGLPLSNCLVIRKIIR